jgi:E3 ubiquitin-protein ligase MARCH6
VPNSDNVALVKGQPATVEVDETGEPVNDKEKRLMQVQDAEAERNKRNIKDDYTIVYMPPHFRWRAISFVAAIWLICSTALASSLAIPILLGRGFFKLFLSYDVHDGYSFFAGFYLLWTCWLINNAIERMDRHRQRRGGGQERADLALYFIKRSLLWSAQAVYMAFCLGVIIPTLIAIIMELYLILPIRHELHPGPKPRIRIVDMWALGLIYTKILLRVQRVRPRGRIALGVDDVSVPS